MVQEEEEKKKKKSRRIRGIIGLRVFDGNIHGN